MTIGWLDTVPARWAVLPAKGLFRERTQASTATDTHLTPSQTYGVVTQADYMQITGNKVVLNLEGADRMKHVEPDDFVIHLRSFQGGIEHSTMGGKVSLAYTVLTPLNRVEPRYFRWLLKSDGYIQELRVTTNQLRDGQSIKFGNFASVALPCPPASEQRQIADFLDRETVRIDTLIDKQQQLIEALRERRAGVLDVAFSESEVGPARLQLRRAIRFLTSGSRGWGDYYSHEGERFLRIGNLPRTSLQLRGDVQFVQLPQEVTEGSRTRLQLGDLLFSITAYLGSVAEVDESWVGAYVSQHVALCRLNERRFLPRYVGWYMLSTEGQNQLKQGAAGGTKQQLALDDVRGLTIPDVNVDEQRRIADYLDEQTSKIDALIKKAQQFIQLSKERRSALITAAVAGQIDVRSGTVEAA